MMRLIAAFVVVCSVTSAQTVPAVPAFGRDEIAIYRDFLLHYPEQLSNEIGMQATTVAFEIPPGPRQPAILHDLIVPAYQVRTLPSEILTLTTEQAVTARIAAKGKLVSAGKRGPQQGPDGYVRTHLTLSDIVFNQQHDRAAFVFSARCDGLCGQGGVVIYEQRHGRWHLLTIGDGWEG